MTTWVIDASAINRVADESADYNATFAGMTSLVESGALTFPDHVLDELERTAGSGPGRVWSNAVKSARISAGASYAGQIATAHSVEEIVDPDDLHDAAVQVLAQARDLSEASDDDVVVVTEDTVDKPTRIALSEGCDRSGITWVSVDVMLARCGIKFD